MLLLKLIAKQGCQRRTTFVQSKHWSQITTKPFDNTINVIGALVFSGLVAYNQGSMEPSLETNFDKNILAQKFDPPRYWLETLLRLESFEQVELFNFWYIVCSIHDNPPGKK